MVFETGEISERFWSLHPHGIFPKLPSLVDIKALRYYRNTMSAVKSSKLTEKYQATVPAEVRAALKLHKGDSVAFELRDDQTVVLRKATPLDLEWSKSLETSLSEWSSPHDEDSYRGL
jgi:AbrB family looped-hinge helix DNA binding protein